MAGSISYDAVVVGSGPNGLAAAIRLAQKKLSVLLVEANAEIGGGVRSAELTLPGFVHDLCSAIHPLALGSPFLRGLGLEKYGLRWIQPEYPLAHPLNEGKAAVLQRWVSSTAVDLGRDNLAYQKLFLPLVKDWETLAPELLRPMLHWPRHPFQLASFGRRAMRSAAGLVNRLFSEEPARALFSGLAAHSFLPLEASGSAAFGLVLGTLGHAVGWPLVHGGSQKLADSLAAHFRALSGEIATNWRVTNIDQLPLARAVLFDVNPGQLLAIAGHKFPERYRQRLLSYRFGTGIFKLDYALSAPIPWRAAACRQSGTVHLGGTFKEIRISEQNVARGKEPERPFVILSQPSLFDESRAPAGKHTAWAYCHVPNGSSLDMTGRMEDQIERFAPGFRDCIVARHTINCADLEKHNSNCVGGDINGGAADFWQLIARPVLSPTPYRTPAPGIYLCSASTPPGGGVHGMCGFHAADAALRDCFR